MRLISRIQRVYFCLGLFLIPAPVFLLAGAAMGNGAAALDSIVRLKDGSVEGIFGKHGNLRFVPIRGLAAEYNGGGHDMAAGATIYSEEEMQEMIRKADAILKEYKETHTGWL